MSPPVSTPLRTLTARAMLRFPRRALAAVDQATQGPFLDVLDARLRRTCWGVAALVLVAVSVSLVAWLLPHLGGFLGLLALIVPSVSGLCAIASHAGAMRALGVCPILPGHPLNRLLQQVTPLDVMGLIASSARPLAMAEAMFLLHHPSGQALLRQAALSKGLHPPSPVRHRSRM